MQDGKLQAIDSLSLRSHIEIRVRNAILNGTFAPGQRLVESTLAEQLAVSRAPVREALSALEREGIVVSVSRRGFFVVDFTEMDIREIYTLRVVLETLAVECAIDRIAEEDIAELQQLIDELGQAIRKGASPEEVVALDLRFHDQIFRLANHSRLYAAWTNIRIQTSVLIGLTSRTEYDYPDQPKDFHQLVLNAIQNRDLEVATTNLREHIRDAEQRAMNSMRAARAAD